MNEVIGYQIESIDGLHNIPDEFYSFQVFSKSFVNEWLKKNNGDGNWKSVPKYEGNIEDPIFEE